MSRPMRVASYVMVPIGAAGLALGIYEITTGDRIAGVTVAVLGTAAAMLALTKIRAP